jgi:hypothetical protein
VHSREQVLFPCLERSPLGRELRISVDPRDADGVNPEALVAMVAALKRLRALSPEAAKQLTLQAALLGQYGLRLQDPERRYQVEVVAEPLTGLEVACLIHAGVQLGSTEAEKGLPLEREYHRATDLC